VPNLLIHRFGIFNVVIFCNIVCSILIFCTLAIHDITGTVVYSALFGFFSGSCKKFRNTLCFLLIIILRFWNTGTYAGLVGRKWQGNRGTYGYLLYIYWCALQYLIAFLTFNRFAGIGGLVGTPIAGALLSTRFIWWRPVLFSALCFLCGALCFAVTRALLARARGTQKVWDCIGLSVFSVSKET
jgi:hypothetical protein